MHFNIVLLGPFKQDTVFTELHNDEDNYIIK